MDAQNSDAKVGVRRTCAYRLFLRFPSSSTEDAFLKSRRERLASMIAIPSVCVLCFVIISVSWTEPWSPIYRASEGARILNVVRNGGHAMMSIMSGICLVISKWRFARETLGAWGLEILGVLHASLIAILLPVITRPYISRFLGYEPHDIFKTNFPEADALFLLNLIIFFTGIHLALPIRMTVLWPFELTCCFIYVLTFLKLGNSQSHFFQFSFGFFLLVIFTAAGKRLFEMEERHNFLMLLREKEKRFRAEFKLSQSVEELQSRQPSSTASLKEPPAYESSVMNSGQSTTATERAFVITDQDLPLSFERIVSIGEHEQWLVPASELRLMPERMLGSGSFGLVMCGEYNGSEVAVKAPKHSAQQDCPESHLGQLCNELRLLRRLRHPNVVVMYGACLDSEHADLALVMELLHGQTLRKFMTNEEPRSLVRVQLLADIGAALAFLHSRRPPVVHGDLKDSNVFVECCMTRLTQCRAKLLDFGLSLWLTKHAWLRGGTPHWMPPEMAVGEPHAPNAKVDVFSFGRVIFFIVTGISPHRGLTRSRLLMHLRKGKVLPLNWPAANSAILGPSHQSLVEQCCCEDAAQRPDICQVQQSLRQAAKAALGDIAAEGPQMLEMQKGSMHEMLERAREALKSRAEDLAQFESSDPNSNRLVSRAFYGNPLDVTYSQSFAERGLSEIPEDGSEEHVFEPGTTSGLQGSPILHSL